MIFNHQKIVFQILFALTILFILLLTISFWNGYLNSNTSKAWPFIFLLLSIATLSSMYLLHNKTSNESLIEEQIKLKVEEERIKLLKELNKNKEEKETNANDTEAISTQVNKIVPKGKFKDVEGFAKKLFVNIAKEIELLQGIFYIADAKKKNFNYLAGYAITSKDPIPGFTLGESLTGQAAQTQELMIIDEIPEDYFDIESGLGKSKPKGLLLLPVTDKKKTIALLELAIFIEVQEKHKNIVTGIAKSVAERLIQIQKS